ncbi:MAG TPA: glycosyltransferase, partial [Candidatus Nanopelagicales bacterium]|nr:glycosyltransferase [Candidatus Nanopelagicales bacterium]
RMRAATLLTPMDDRGGTADVVRALSKLPGTSLGILTSGDDEAERRRLHLLARQLHVDDRVHWVPGEDRVDVLRAVEGADVLVHVPHERLELAPVVAAMSVTTAVVVTDLPDADGVVVNGCTGLRVPPAEPHGLALRLSILSADPSMRDEVSLAARRFVRDELAPSITAASVLESYARVVGLRESA